MAKTKDWKEEKVDKLIKRMRCGDDVVYFNDDDVFGESMFDAESILQEKLKNIDEIFCVYSPIAKDDYLYVWEGDHISLLTTKSKMKILVN
jgi:hypothetical protein